MKLYVICATERSGSSLLAHGLAQAGTAGDPRELLHPNLVASISARSELATLAKPLTTVLGTHTGSGLVAKPLTSGGPDVLGAKVLWSHLENLARLVSSLDGASVADPGQLLDEVLPDVASYVWLYRRDRLRQAVSLERALHSGVWWRLTTEPGHEAGPPDLDPADVELTAELLLAQDDSWGRYFAARGAQPLRVAYEDLASDYERVVGRVLRHIGAGLPVGRRIPPPVLARQADSYSEQLVSRIRSSTSGTSSSPSSASFLGAVMPSSLQIVVCFGIQRAYLAASLTQCLNSMTAHRAVQMGADGALVAGEDPPQPAKSQQVDQIAGPGSQADFLAEADLVIAIDGAFPGNEAFRHVAVLTLVSDHQAANFSSARNGQPGVVVGNHTALLCASERLSVVPEPVCLPTASDSGPATDKMSVFYSPQHAIELIPEGNAGHWSSRGTDTTFQVLSKLAGRGLLRLSVPAGDGVTPKEAWQAIRASHVVIDEVATGSYHTASLMGLAGACVVVNAMGLRPDIVALFRSCAGDVNINPFTFARLETLEGVLTSLAARGPEALQDEGHRNLDWFRQHWSFERQWDRFWWPAVRSALAARLLPTRQRHGTPELLPRLHTPDVSVVVPTLDEGKMLLSTIDGLHASTPNTTEFVVVDDLSTDGSPDDLRGISRVQVLRPSERLGVARARNYGAAAARGDVIIFCDAHVVPADGWLAPLLGALELPDVGAVSPAVGVLGRPDHPPGHGGRWGRWREEASLEWGWAGRAGPDPAPVPLLCGISAIRRSVFDEIQGFDNGMLLYGLEDCEISFHLWTRGYQCLAVPKSSVDHMFKDKHNFPVSWKFWLYNALRLAVVHFNAQRVARLTERLRKNAEFPAAAAMLAESDVWTRRQWIRSTRQHNDDWYFTQFHLE